MRTRAKLGISKTTTRSVIVVVTVIFLAVLGSLITISSLTMHSTTTKTTVQTRSSSSSSSSSSQEKPIILYINQGNGAVNESNFSDMLNFATAQGFNTIFFMVDYKGDQLFNANQMMYFVSTAHSQGLKIFFVLSFTNDSQEISSSVYNIGEDGISLDMSTLDPTRQSNLLSMLEANYHGTTAITTYDFTTTLKPDWLILETYGNEYDTPQYVHSGIIASVGIFATSSRQDYENQFHYCLTNSDGVMVFDYAGLLKSDY